jgi:hypothetical protein
MEVELTLFSWLDYKHVLGNSVCKLSASYVICDEAQ